MPAPFRVITSMERCRPKPRLPEPPRSRRPLFISTRAASMAGARPKKMPITRETRSEYPNTRHRCRLPHPWSAGGMHRQHGAQRKKGKTDAKCAARQGEEQTFREQLADNAQGRSAQCGADCHFAPPCRSPSQRQVRHVGAGNQQHKPTQPISITSAGRTWLVKASLIDLQITPKPTSLVASSRCRRAATPSSSARACCRLTPSGKRIKAAQPMNVGGCADAGCHGAVAAASIAVPCHRSNGSQPASRPRRCRGLRRAE